MVNTSITGANTGLTAYIQVIGVSTSEAVQAQNMIAIMRKIAVSNTVMTVDLTISSLSGMSSLNIVTPT